MPRYTKQLIQPLLLASIALSASISVRAATGPEACAALRQIQLPDATVTSTEFITNGHFQPPGEGDSLRAASTAELKNLPPFCRVSLTIKPQIRVEVWLPGQNWNQRFQAVGGGGYAGFIAYDSLGEAIRNGYAGSSTDTGHSASIANGKFVLNADHTLNQQQIDDFAHRAVHEMAVKAKTVIAAYYQSPPRYSYWNGCSTGGRQGLMEAQRYPKDFDGILSMAPAINWDRFIPAEIWSQLVMQQDLGAPIPAAKLHALQQAIIAEYDKADGVVDEVIDDPRIVHPSDKLMASAGLNTAEIAAMRKIWTGPRTANGSFMWYGLEPTAPLIGLGGAQPFPIVVDYIGIWLQQNPQWDWKSMDYAAFERFFEQSRQQFHARLATDNPDLSQFAEEGGKLMMWHGWDDQLIFPRGTIDYFQRVQAAAGGEEATSKFAKLFMAPGVMHCRGGVGPDKIEALPALVKWGEQGKAPQQILATKEQDGKVIRTRPICAYPQRTVYSGKGSSDDAANFSCMAPAPKR